MYKKFLDPTTDITFKKIFGDKAKTDILIDFLNTILCRAPGTKINKIIIVDPVNHPEVISSKLSIVDIKCRDEAGQTYIVEMQVVNESGYLNRAQYYTCLEVSRQLDKGERYRKLKPVILVAVSNFDLFENNRYLNHYLLLNTETYENDLKLVEFHFIELSKFNKKLEEVNSIVDQWAYFLKHASEVYEVPKELKDNESITKAFRVLEQTNFTRQELEEYDKSIDEYRLELGRTTERQDFFEEGQLAKAIDIAKELLSENMSVEKISKITGLPVENIKNLK